MVTTINAPAEAPDCHPSHPACPTCSVGVEGCPTCDGYGFLNCDDCRRWVDAFIERDRAQTPRQSVELLERSLGLRDDPLLLA